MLLFIDWIIIVCMFTYEWMNWLMIDVCIKIMKECMFVKNFVSVKFVVDVKKIECPLEYCDECRFVGRDKRDNVLDVLIV